MVEKQEKVGRNVYSVTFMTELMETPEAPKRTAGARKDVDTDTHGNVVPVLEPQIKRWHGPEVTRLVIAYTPEGASAFVRAEATSDAARVIRCGATLVLGNVDQIPTAPESAPKDTDDPGPVDRTNTADGKTHIVDRTHADDDNLTVMSKADRKEELDGKSKAELKDLAEQHDVSVTSDMNKAEITSKLNRQLNKEAKTGT
jgi:hypothetical protein